MLDCDTCEQEYLHSCPRCGKLVAIRDTTVPMGTKDRAKLTVPKVLEVRSSNKHGLGIYALTSLRKGLRMGPYVGQLVPATNAAPSNYAWKLRNGRMVDAADETVSNWLRYVNCANHCSEQNLVAFQYKGQLYYRTSR